MRTMQTGIIWTALVGAAVAGGIAATSATAPSASSICVPCPDGGSAVVQYRGKARPSQELLRTMRLECEIKPCELSP